jgi:hypothetical protein
MLPLDLVQKIIISTLDLVGVYEVVPENSDTNAYLLINRRYIITNMNRAQQAS